MSVTRLPAVSTDELPPYYADRVDGNVLKHELYSYLEAHGFNVNRVEQVVIGVTEVEVRQHAVTESGAFIHSKNVQVTRNPHGTETDTRLFDGRGKEIDGVDVVGPDTALKVVTSLPIANPIRSSNDKGARQMTDDR